MKNLALKNKNKRNLTLNLLMAGTATAFLFSCAPKPAVVEGTKMKSVEYLAQGQTIFQNSCGKCHDLPNPADHSAQDWVGIMNRMAPKAKLTDPQHDMVFDYIVSAKK